MADLRAEMSKFIAGDKETVSETPKQEAKEVTEEKVEKDSADVDQSDEDEDKQEAKPEDKEEKVEDDEEGKKEDKPSKPNRYQRVKKQRDEVVAKLNHMEGNFHKAVKVANEWRQEAKLLEKELESVKSKAKTAGYDRSPEEDRAFLSEREAANLRLQKEYDEQLQGESLKKQALAMKEKLKQEFIESAHTLSEKYGLSPKKLMTTYYAELEAGEKITMEDVAKDLGELNDYRKKKVGIDKQIQVNDSAPRPKKPGKAVGVDYPATPEGMKSWLVSNGLANKE
jgi:hypothetical protein